MKRFSLRETIETEKGILRLAGIYSENHSQLPSLRNFRFYITASISCLLEVSLMILIFLNIKDLRKVMAASMLFVQQTAFIIKLSIFAYKREKLQMLEVKIVEFSHHQSDMSDMILHKKNLDKIFILSLIYRVSCGVCCTFFAVGPFINKKSKYELPLPGYVPYEIKNGIVYAATFILQMSSLYLAAALNTTVDILNCRLLTVASSSFEILIKRLNDFACKSIVYQRDEFKRCVHFHIEILRFINGIEDLYSHIVFSQLAASVIVICSTAFELLTLPIGSGGFIGSLMYLINMIAEVALYCWYGHDIQTLSHNLGRACFMSQWYNTDSRIKKMITIFMERTKRPVTLTAAKLFPLSLMTLKMILRSSYSYFAVLQRVYSDK